MAPSVRTTVRQVKQKAKQKNQKCPLLHADMSNTNRKKASHTVKSLWHTGDVEREEGFGARKKESTGPHRGRSQLSKDVHPHPHPPRRTAEQSRVQCNTAQHMPFIHRHTKADARQRQRQKQTQTYTQRVRARQPASQPDRQTDRQTDQGAKEDIENDIIPVDHANPRYIVYTDNSTL